jgi:hypothetical protein
VVEISRFKDATFQCTFGCPERVAGPERVAKTLRPVQKLEKNKKLASNWNVIEN